MGQTHGELATHGNPEPGHPMALEDLVLPMEDRVELQHRTARLEPVEVQFDRGHIPKLPDTGTDGAAHDRPARTDKASISGPLVNGAPRIPAGISRR